jgi:hypothetical protein
MQQDGRVPWQPDVGRALPAPLALNRWPRSVPSGQRGALVDRFRSDPACGVQRDHDGKRDVIVYDYVDGAVRRLANEPDVPILASSRLISSNTNFTYAPGQPSIAVVIVHHRLERLACQDFIPSLFEHVCCCLDGAQPARITFHALRAAAASVS